MSLAQSAKFRPVLNQDQISHICELCRRDSSSQSMSVLAVLASFEWKIKSGAVTPAYTPQLREDLINSLGFSEPNDPTHFNPTHGHNLLPEQLYALWADDPSKLDAYQLQIVRRYRYENNKMTVDEEQVYEAEILGLNNKPLDI